MIQEGESPTGGGNAAVRRHLFRPSTWRKAAVGVERQSPPADPADDDEERLQVPSWVPLLGALAIAAAGAVKPIAHFEGSAIAEYWAELGILLVAELGVALLVAWVIGTVLDVRIKRREERRKRREATELSQRREAEQVEAFEREQRLVQDVFRGVLGIRHSAAYVRKVVETTLEQKVIRRGVSIIYTLRRLDDKERSRVKDPDRFMILDQVVNFELHNLSAEDVTVPVKLSVPYRHGNNLKTESKVQAVVIAGKPLPPDEIVESGSFGDTLCYSWDRDIPALGKLSVLFKVRLIKEESDTEVWSSAYPCSEGVTLQVVAPADLHMGIRNITASKVRTETAPTDNGIGLWKIDGPVLPNDSVVFYWRTEQDEGGAQVADPPRLPDQDGSGDRASSRDGTAAAR